MCLILLAMAVSETFPLVVAANRDEFFARETTPAGFWPGTDLLAGHDDRKGGTWFGLTRRGRLAMVTNVRTPATEASHLSRGHLVRDYLLSDLGPELFVPRVVEPADRYPGFNLLLGDMDALFFASNRSHDRGWLPGGVYGLSNAGLNTPWPKVAQGRIELERALALTGDELVNELFSLLQDRKVAADADLPDTGIGLEWERTLSARFIRGGDYGTRASTVLLFDRARRALFIERSFGSDGECYNERRFTLVF